jgi:superfamily II DNA or RNA helicase
MPIQFDKIKHHDILDDGIVLRDYQISAKKDIYDAWCEYQNIMFQMPTGTGKTMLFSSIIKDLHEYGKGQKKAVKVLILAHRDELIAQISESIGLKYGIAHGKIKSRHDEEKNYPTQVASVQTLHKRLEKWEHKDFDIIIIDEAHHAPAKTYKNIRKTFPNAKLLGVTATPYRLNAEPFPPMFDKLICSMSINQFIKADRLSEYKYYSIKPTSKIQRQIDEMELDKISGDYSERAMMDILDNKKIRANILETYQKIANGKRGIIYTINRTHNKHVCDTFRENGYLAEAIDAKTPPEKRKEIVDKFKSGEIQILCNVNIFSEGFDCPDVEFIQLARPTVSLSMYLQQVGRGFRWHEDKDHVIFLDNVGQYNRFGLPSLNRNWQNYFEGKHKGIDLTGSSVGALKEIDEKTQTIDEGDEDVKQIYNSITETEEPNDDIFWKSEKVKNDDEIEIENKDEEDNISSEEYKDTPNDKNGLRLSKVAIEFNVSVHKIIEFLKDKGVNISQNPNSKLTPQMYDLLKKAFTHDIFEEAMTVNKAFFKTFEVGFFEAWDALFKFRANIADSPYMFGQDKKLVEEAQRILSTQTIKDEFDRLELLRRCKKTGDKDFKNYFAGATCVNKKTGKAGFSFGSLINRINYRLKNQ